MELYSRWDDKDKRRFDYDYLETPQLSPHVTLRQVDYSENKKIYTVHIDIDIYTYTYSY